MAITLVPPPSQPLDAALTAIAAIADVQGDILVRGAAGWERLAKSATATDVLTAGATQPAWAAPTGGGSVATDTIWDAAGDLAVGTGPDAAARLGIGTALQTLRVNAGATALEWATPTVPIASGVSGLGAGVATFLATPSSANLAATVTGETGTGALVFATSPALVTPDLGTPSAGVLTSATGLPISTGVSGLGAGVATFLGTPSSANLAAAVTGETGTGALVFATSPALVTPDLGTPSAGVLTSATGLPVSTGIAGLGSGVATFLATPSSANLATAVTGETGSGALVFGTSPTLVTPLLGTPTSGVLTNATGLPVSTGISGLGTGVATLLATPSSANLLAAITDETGTGVLVFAGSPTFTGVATTPVLAASGITGAVAATRYVGGTASSYPSSGTFAIGDFVIDQTGQVWVCTVAGSPGTWAASGSGRELGYTEITSGQTTAAIGSANRVDITGLTVTVTVASRPVVVEISFGSVSNDTVDRGVGVAIVEGTTILAQSIGTSAAANGPVPCKAKVRLAPSAGAHTYKGMFWATAAGNGSVLVGTASPGFVMVTEV